jgi:hypothetical protein
MSLPRIVAALLFAALLFCGGDFAVALAPPTPKWLDDLGLTPFMCASLCDVAYDNTRIIRGGERLSVVQPSSPQAHSVATFVEFAGVYSDASTGAGFSLFWDSARFLLVVAFRGSRTATDAYTQARMELSTSSIPWPYGTPEDAQTIYVQARVAELYAAVRGELLDRLKLYPLAETFLLTGHSLGGGMASIAATDVGATFEQRVHCITFGSPRMGSERLGMRHRAVVANTMRVVAVCERCLERNAMALVSRWACYDQISLQPTHEKGFNHVTDDATYVTVKTGLAAVSGGGWEQVMHAVSTYEAALYSGDPVPVEAPKPLQGVPIDPSALQSADEL